MRFSIKSVLLILTTAVLVLSSVMFSLLAEEEEKAEGRKPLVVMRQAEINGRVFLIGEKDDAEELARQMEFDDEDLISLIEGRIMDEREIGNTGLTSFDLYKEILEEGGQVCLG